MINKEPENITNIKPRPNAITNNKFINRDQHNISIEYEDTSEQSLYSAKPAHVEDDTDERFDDILRSAMEMSHQEIIKTEFANLKISESNGIDESLVSSSSLEDSIQIYNVPRGEIVKNQRDIQSADLDNNDNIVIHDKHTEKRNDINLVSAKNDMMPLVAPINGKMANGENYNLDQESEIILPKVKDLAKKFVKIESFEEYQQPKSTPRRRKFSNDYELEVVNKSDPKLAGKHIGYMHSLTARSISREFREELKQSMAIPIKVPGGANELPEGMEDVTRENSRPASPVPEPGTLKNKLAFFESLKF